MDEIKEMFKISIEIQFMIFKSASNRNESVSTENTPH